MQEGDDSACAPSSAYVHSRGRLKLGFFSGCLVPARIRARRRVVVVGVCAPALSVGGGARHLFGRARGSSASQRVDEILRHAA